ncbi:MAG: divergent PAP2 family protein, partial [bacterium]
GWMAASILKMLANLRQTGRVDFQYLASLGGMPSAHSAMVSGLATAVGLREGFGSTIFAVTLAFAAVVMFDASTVRRATGLQARLLNQIVDEVFKHHHLSAQKLKEILGHTRMEVFAGMLVGITTGLVVGLWTRPPA